MGHQSFVHLSFSQRVCSVNACSESHSVPPILLLLLLLLFSRVVVFRVVDAVQDSAELNDGFVVGICQ